MKQIYTTGEAADVCKVSQQTIIRCFDAGRLKGFRVPGSKFRRIPHDALVEFMRSNNIPDDHLAGDAASRRRRVLVVDDDPEIVELFCDVLDRDGRFEVHSAATGYEAGLLTSELRPDLILLDYLLPDINGNRALRRRPQQARAQRHQDHHRQRRHRRCRGRGPARRRGRRFRRKAVRHRPTRQQGRGDAERVMLTRSSRR